MKIIKPNILFGNLNFSLFKNFIKFFNLKKNFLSIKRFKDGELKILISKNFIKKTVFFFHSLCFPIHENIIKLLLVIDALKRLFVKNIYLFIPYFCYSRQDKMFDENTSISIKVITKILEKYFIKKIIIIDPHSNNFECFVNFPIKILQSTSLIINDLVKNLFIFDIVISPDIGGINRAKNLANYLNLELVIIDKRRPIFNFVKIFCIIGIVTNKSAIIIDDIIDTSNSFVEIVNFLQFHKINNIVAYITHPLFSNNSFIKINKLNFNKLIVMDTVNFNNFYPKIKIISTKYIFIEELKKDLLNLYEM